MKIVAIGASAGGVEALRRIAADLPPDLPVPVLVVLHVSASAGSILAQILDRVSPMTCTPGRDGERLEPGHLYVAPPDRHLLVEDGTITLDAGPRENGHRPAIDPLFCSVAAAFGPTACGIVLSGTRHDGTAGLAAIKARGGTTVVQDPEDALYPGMPASAIANVAIDAVLTAQQIGGAIVALAGGGPLPAGVATPDDPPPHVGPDEPPSAGRIGEGRGLESFAAKQADVTERVLWTAIRALESRAASLRRMADGLSRRGLPQGAAGIMRQAAETSAEADAVRTAVERFGSVA